MDPSLILRRLKGNAINALDTNFSEFHRLCEEFGFSKLSAKLSEFRSSIDFKETEDLDVQARIGRLKKRQINTPKSVQCCRTKSLSSPQILCLLSVKFQHFDLVQREFRTHKWNRS
jgi:hypothetical protein